jgi:DNA-binding CsgD family transcriptional regulator
MSRSARLRVDDLRAIHQVVGECRDLGDDPVAWRQHWFGHLARTTGAGLIVGGEVTGGCSGPIQPVGTAERGWENGFDRAAWLRVMATEHGSDIVVSPLVKGCFDRLAREDGVCLSMSDVVDDRTWRRSLYYDAIHRPTGLGHTMACFLPLAGEGDEYSGVTLAREANARRDFGPREKLLVQESHAALLPLVGGPLARFTDPSPAELPPRVRQVLRCLLEGDGDKQIASRLKLSPYTINQYVKHIFKHFGAQSRTELLARWVRRGWANGFSWAGD